MLNFLAENIYVMAGFGFVFNYVWKVSKIKQVRQGTKIRTFWRSRLIKLAVAFMSIIACLMTLPLLNAILPVVMPWLDSIYYPLVMGLLSLVYGWLNADIIDIAGSFLHKKAKEYGV